MIRFQFIFLLLIGSFFPTLHAQVTGEDQDQNPLVQQAMIQLQAAMQAPKGELYLFGLEHQLHGTFTYDLTIRKKGEVATVFVVSSEDAKIIMQNQLKDRLKVFRFKLTVPKGQAFKFRYSFKFS